MMYPEKLLRVELLFLGSERDKALDFVREFPRFHTEDLRLRMHEMLAYASPVYVEEFIIKLEDAIRRLNMFRIPAKPAAVELPADMYEAANEIHKRTLILYEEYSKYVKKMNNIREEIEKLKRALKVYDSGLPLPIPKELKGLFIWIGFPERLPDGAVVFKGKLGKRTIALVISDKPVEIEGEELDVELFMMSKEELKAKIEELKSKIKELNKELEERKRKNARLVEALFRAAKLLEVKLSLLGRGLIVAESVYYLEGRIPERDAEEFLKKLKKYAPGALVLFRKPSRDEHPPTLFRPKSELSKASHELTDVYGITDYREVNPSRVVLITFPLFFGMMFADIAHGLILMLFGRLARKYAHKFPEYLQMFPKGSKMIIYMGFWATIFGTIFGDFAGFEIVHTHRGEKLAHEIPLLGLASGDLASRILLLQYVSIIIAVLHITRGLIVNIYDKIKKGDYYRALFVSLPRLISYSLFIGPIGYLILLREVISPELYWRLFPGMKILDAYFYLELEKKFLHIAIAVGALMFPGSILIAKHHGHPVFDTFIEAGFIHFIEAFITSLSNTVSYLRLLALNLAHYLLSTVFIDIAFSSSNLLYAAAIYLIGQILVLVIESISASLHAIRLHRVEFFSKLDLSWSGQRFRPIVIWV